MRGSEFCSSDEPSSRSVCFLQGLCGEHFSLPRTPALMNPGRSRDCALPATPHPALRTHSAANWGLQMVIHCSPSPVLCFHLLSIYCVLGTGQSTGQVPETGMGPPRARRVARQCRVAPGAAVAAGDLSAG